MNIRRALASEAPALSALAFESKAHWGYSAAQMGLWRKALTISGSEIECSETFTVEDNGTLLGFCSLHRKAKTLKIEHFWVAPKHLRKGVGRVLMAACVDLAGRSGAERIEIDSDPHAEGFYLACGATRVGAVPAPIDGQPQRERPQLLLVTRSEHREKEPT